MRIIRFIDSSGAVQLGHQWDGASAATLLGGDLFSGVQDTGRPATVSRILPPIDPRAILCIGLNYRAHAVETKAPIPDRPVLFMKNPAAASAHLEPIILPATCRDPLQVDFECELAVIIGKAARNVALEHALGHVLGYTVGNDVSARTWQKQWSGGQWIRGKSFDTFCPFGPLLVTADEIPDPQTLRLTTRLNGQIMQDSNTSDMIFPIARLIHELSQDTTLLPGTLIMTGTPSGVGVARDPQVFLKPGDRLEMEISSLCKLENHVE